MELAELKQAGRQPDLPLNLNLEDAAGPATLVLTQLLRVLPGQRYVGVAEWRGRKVLAKVLVGDKTARHFERELQGAGWLAEQGLPTPPLLAHGVRDGEGGWLLFDYLESASSLWDGWRAVEQQPLLSEAQQTVLAQALTLIGQLHGKGLWQADLHLDNLMQHGGQLFIIDGGGVQAEVPGQPLSKSRVLANLGVFFAQLPAELEPFLEELLVHYLLANGAHALPLEALLKEIARTRQWRLRDYLRKVARDCSLFSAVSGPFGLQVILRREQHALAPVLVDIDRVIEQGQRFKDGGSATVARIALDDRSLVGKRYNIKHFAHWLRRFWRPSRAWHSWIEGHRLQVLGITTPQPLAVLERRWCWLRGRAYLITEYCGGQDIIARFQGHLHGSPPEAELLALDRLFAALLRERISHGDFKGHNLLWDEARACWSLIDLDAMQQHHSARSFALAYARDRARFLRNWPAESALYQLLNQRLPRVPDTRQQ
ncbi:lipopolysaccharide kinase InaA family protein [Pseudomonas borbori]